MGLRGRSSGAMTGPAGPATARWVTALLAGLVAACGGGSGEGLDSSGRPLVPGADDDGPLVASFESIQAHVLTPLCTVCHAGSAAPLALRLDAANAYASLVGVPSVEASSLLRVAPGRSDDSYLIHKLEGRAAVGARMPLGGPYLDAETMAVIRQWIAAGALPAPATSTANSVELESVP
jgi:hypothetical protein